MLNLPETALHLNSTEVLDQGAFTHTRVFTVLLWVSVSVCSLRVTIRKESVYCIEMCLTDCVQMAMTVTGDMDTE